MKYLLRLAQIYLEEIKKNNYIFLFFLFNLILVKNIFINKFLKKFLLNFNYYL